MSKENDLIVALSKSMEAICQYTEQKALELAKLTFLHSKEDETKAAERRGAERMVALIDNHFCGTWPRQFDEDFQKEIWQEWENTKS